jgi:hypothetical protein
MTDRTPLQQLQDEALRAIHAGGFGGFGSERAALDAYLVRAYDMGVRDMRDLDRDLDRSQSTGSHRTDTHYIVSTENDRVVSDDGSRGFDPTQYQTPEEAGDGIRSGFHGQAGTRYVLKVDLSVEATYERGWELVRKTGSDGTDN